MVVKEDVSRLNDQLGKSIKSVDINEQIYKSEIDKMNKLYIDCEDKYKEIIKKLRDIKIDKIRFFSDVLKIFYNISSDLIKKHTEIHKNLEKIPENVKVNRDIIIYDEKFYFYNDNKKRFLLEQFLDFKKFKKNLSEKENIKEKKNNDEKDIKDDIINKVFNLGKNDDSFIENDDEAKADSLFLKYLLFNQNKISDKDYDDILRKINRNDKNIIRFMSVLITFYKSNQIVRMENSDNFKYLSNILDEILNKCLENKTLFEICYMIIYVAEKTVYVDKNNIYKRQYICELLSMNKNFQDTSFWINLIDTKIKMCTNRKVKQEIEIKEDKDKE